jgi:hypothetical protein
MAKSARASTKKNNKTALRAKVFGPVEEARNERLSTRLLALVSEPKPQPASTTEATEEVPMDDVVEQKPTRGRTSWEPRPGPNTKEAAKAAAASAAMDVDDDDHAETMTRAERAAAAKTIGREVGKGRISKRNGGKKQSSSMVFPVGRKHGGVVMKGRRKRA